MNIKEFLKPTPFKILGSISFDLGLNIFLLLMGLFGHSKGLAIFTLVLFFLIFYIICSYVNLNKTSKFLAIILAAVFAIFALPFVIFFIVLSSGSPIHLFGGL